MVTNEKDIKGAKEMIEDMDAVTRIIRLSSMKLALIRRLRSGDESVKFYPADAVTNVWWIKSKDRKQTVEVKTNGELMTDRVMMALATYYCPTGELNVTDEQLRVYVIRSIYKAITEDLVDGMLEKDLSFILSRSAWDANAVSNIHMLEAFSNVFKEECAGLPDPPPDTDQGTIDQWFKVQLAVRNLQ